MEGKFTVTASSYNPDAFSKECKHCHMKICSTRGPSGVPDDHSRHERECELDYKLAKCLYEAERDLEMWTDTEWEDLTDHERYSLKWSVGRMCDFMGDTLRERLAL